MLYSDQPIRSVSEDILGRRRFARGLATAIDELKIANEGFVFALEGEWGSGKSSVIELLILYLLYGEMARASESPVADDIVAVPKSIDEITQLHNAYRIVEPQIKILDAAGANLTYWQRRNRIGDFRRLCAAEADPDATAEAADRFWKLKLAVSFQPRTLVVRFNPWLISGRAELASALLGELGRALGDRLGPDVKKAFGDLVQHLAELAPVAGALINAASGTTLGSIATGGGGWAKSLATTLTTGDTLDALRRKLQDALRNLSEQRILVVIDDLDRLTSTEALRMVSVVKSLGDLPNVIYLLSYDEKKLASLIQQKIKSSGHQFLQKIIQHSEPLPSLSEDSLFALLRTDLVKLLGTLNQGRLDHIWLYVLRYYLDTPRAVRRLVNTLSIKLASLGKHLDPMQILIVEALRLNEPRLHRWMRDNLDRITS